MRECCRQTLNDCLERYCRENQAPLNPALTLEINRALTTYREYSGFVSKLCDVKVANLGRPASAVLIRAPCPDCHEASALCVLGATLMLSVIRFALLFAQLIERWEYIDDRLHIRTRAPTPAEVHAYRQLVMDYYGDEPVAKLAVWQMLAEHAQLNSDLAAELFSGITLGQLFILAHELAHLLEPLGTADATLSQVRARLNAALENFDIGPITRQRWVSELLADATAAEMLLGAVSRDLACKYDPAHLPFLAARKVSLGFALACEALTHVENRLVQQGKEGASTHPPMSVRYQIVSVAIENHLPDGRPDHFPLTNTIAHISNVFYTSVYGARA